MAPGGPDWRIAQRRPCRAGAAGRGRLLEPHGTLSGQLIVTADQVLKGLEGSWEHQLRANVRGRTIVFVSYSGWDLDFQPLWNDVLQAAGRALWSTCPTRPSRDASAGSCRGSRPVDD
jgi:hypothetical protein